MKKSQQGWEKKQLRLKIQNILNRAKDLVDYFFNSSQIVQFGWEILKKKWKLVVDIDFAQWIIMNPSTTDGTKTDAKIFYERVKRICLKLNRKEQKSKRNLKP